MSQKNETIPLILALLISIGIIGSGVWWFEQKSNWDLSNLLPAEQNSTPPQSPTNQTTKSNEQAVSPDTFTAPTNVPQGTTIAINGSTSMVQINQIFKNSFEQQFDGTTVVTKAQGTNKGIELLQDGRIDVAAISRPLTAQEQATGLAAVPIAKDAIAIVVGVNNPFRRGLSKSQVVDIFKGKITNWSVLGGENRTIKVINRPSISGTYQIFRQLVLQGSGFGNTPNFVQTERDGTTLILRALDTNGISYATYTQVANQRTIRTVAVNGLTPEATNYPYQRTLYYAYQQPASPQVQAFLGYVLSTQGLKTELK